MMVSETLEESLFQSNTCYNIDTRIIFLYVTNCTLSTLYLCYQGLPRRLKHKSYEPINDEILDNQELISETIKPNRKLRISLEFILIVGAILYLRLQKFTSVNVNWQIAFWLVPMLLIFLRSYYFYASLTKATNVLYTSFFTYLSLLLSHVVALRDIAIQCPKSSLWIHHSILSLASLILFLLLGLTLPSEESIIVKYDRSLLKPIDSGVSLLGRAFYTFLNSFLKKGIKASLDFKDVPSLPYYLRTESSIKEFRKLYANSFTKKLLKHIYLYLAAQFFISILAEGFLFFPFSSLNHILTYVNEPTSISQIEVSIYIIMFAGGLALKAVFSNLAYQIGRYISVEVRSIIISEVYSKTLRKQASATVKKCLDDENISNMSNASAGKIVNLISNDAFRISDLSAYLHLIVSQVIFAIFLFTFLLYRILGWSAFVCLVLMALLTPINLKYSNAFASIESELLKFTDKRINLVGEILESLRIIKCFAWEKFFEKNVLDIRQNELNLIRKRFVLWTLIACLWYSIPFLLTIAVFGCFIYIQKQPLTTPIAFSALTIIQELRTPFDVFADMLSSVLESKVSLERVASFMAEPECQKIELLQKPHHPGDPKLGFKDASFCWSEPYLDQTSNNTFKLQNLNIIFPVGDYTIIVGPTGAGKSSMLHALLGEMPCISGEVYLPSYSFSDGELTIKSNPNESLLDCIAFCSQQAWLMNGTIRSNILFGLDFNAKRYQEVIKACALQADFDILPAHDLSMVGEKGLTLSGGQKQRVSLARALYSRAKHVLMDDCLSAVDSHTAEWIFSNGLIGQIMSGRTRILVSHNVHLALPKADHVVLFSEGKILAQGKPSDLADTGYVAVEDERLSKDIIANVNKSHLIDTIAEEPKICNIYVNDEDITIDDEEVAVGSVRWNVYKLFYGSVGNLPYWAIVFVTFISEKAFDLGAAFWVRKWASTYSEYSCWQIFTAFPVLEANYESRTAYFVGYIILIVCFISIVAIRFRLLLQGSLRASKNLHENLLYRILRARARFLDTCPTGRILNRFSKDFSSIDQDLIFQGQSLISCFINVLAIQFILISLTAYYLIFSILVGVMLYRIGNLYLCTARQLRRFETASRSPVIQHFSETVDGLITIRAYGHSKRFMTRNVELLNTMNRFFHHYWFTNRWLTLRLDFFASAINLLAASLAVLMTDKIDSGLLGIALYYSISASAEMLWLVRFYTLNEINLNSVELVDRYSNVEIEDQAETKIPLPKNWPEAGHVQIDKLKIQYDPTLPVVIRELSIEFPAGSKIGVVGRSGAGKSSLAASLLRLVEPVSGKIKIDGINIADISLETLRNAISYIPQDPVLFGNTLRFNLDPSGRFTNLEAYEALKVVCLISDEEFEQAISGASNIDSKNKLIDLNFSLNQGGKNLSQGERQLICLARSLMKKSKLIVMDESTASVDFAIQERIQEAVLNQYGSATVFTIAHRLSTIISYDYVLVMSNGEMKEFASPKDLLSDENSYFTSLCKASKEYDIFVEQLNRIHLDNQ